MLTGPATDRLSELLAATSRPVIASGGVFFFNDTATTEIYTLSLHDALPISAPRRCSGPSCMRPCARVRSGSRSEEHTSELQSHSDLVCRLLLEKKKKNT